MRRWRAKGNGKELNLSNNGNLLVENRNGLMITTELFQTNHRASRNWRNPCAALPLAGTGFACCVRSNHSRMVGRSAAHSSSLFSKSERLMPSRAGNPAQKSGNQLRR